MPEMQMRNTETRQQGELNEAQRRRLAVTCSYVDGLLCEMEHILHEPESKSPFPRHEIDVTPAQKCMLENHIGRIREQLLRALAWQGLSPEPAEIPATRAVLAYLAYVDIAFEELKPRYMRGSGVLTENVAEELDGVACELRSVAQNMEHDLRLELSARDESRQDSLEQPGRGVA